ncbi:MAG TPA: FtsX-like permease family protein [Jatrophihabitans sp.]|uniref:FtsX-like permease family protein n=1 Tax=Jatrophihabitans sp. TaxID=1932789 RepID=UPI002EEAB560
MIRLLLVRLWAHRLRGTALVIGVAAASTAFIVLTGQVEEQRLELRGKVDAEAISSYDILVRPANSRTELEKSQALVRANFLSGQFGGITLRQWRQIQQLDGVQVAAPVAMVGYVIQSVVIPIDITDQLSPAEQRLFTASVRRLTARGLSQFRQPDISYSYVTPQPVRRAPAQDDPRTQGVSIAEADGTPRLVCPIRLPATGGPFEVRSQRNGTCWSRANGPDATGFTLLPRGRAGILVQWNFPLLLAAIDPEQEARLAGLDSAVTRGRYLPQNGMAPGRRLQSVPVLMAEHAGFDAQDEISIERLTPEATAEFGAGLPSERLDALLERERGAVVASLRVTAETAYQRLLATRLRPNADDPIVASYWTSGRVSYGAGPDGSLRPRPVTNPASVWKAPVNVHTYVAAPPEAADTAFRRLSHHPFLATGETPSAGPRLAVIGAFDQSRLDGGAHALGGYRTAPLTPADPASSALLQGRSLLPDSNIAGYLLPAPALLTSLDAASVFTDSSVFDNVSDAAPISAVKIRVAGVRGVDPVSRERVRLVAEAVMVATGLDVDVTVGSSPTNRRILLPAGSAGRPELQLYEQWQRKGVAVTVLRAIDRKSLLLFVLVLVVCGVFIANAAAAAARSPRRELSTLSCLGWSRGQLLRLMLGEMAVIGVSAGVLGALAALAGARGLGVPVSTGRALASVPAALVLTLLAAAWPVWRASLPAPLSGALATGRPRSLPGSGDSAGGGSPRGLLQLAYLNLRGDPGRTGLGMAAVALGSAGLTTVLAITMAFHGSMVGSLLGDVISLQARRVDYLAVAITLALAAVAVADVSYLNMRERREDLALLRAVGWTNLQLGRLITIEGVLIGLAGSAAGASLGLGVTALLAGSTPGALWLLAGLTMLTGVLVSALATLLAALSLPLLVGAPSLTED